MNALGAKRIPDPTTAGGFLRSFTTNGKWDYRIIALRKKVEVTKGQLLLFENYRYIFYVTNIYDKSAFDLLPFIRGRCNHEIKIEQLDNGTHALKMPASEFIAN